MCSDHLSQRLPHPESLHETFPDLHGIAPGCCGSRPVVDAYPDQRRSGCRQGLFDQSLEILFVGRPGAVGKAASGRDGTAIEVPDPVLGGEEWEAWTVSEIVGTKPGVIYFTSSLNTDAVAAVTVSAGGGVRRWVYRRGAWQ